MAGERDPHEFPMMAVSMQWCPARSRNACAEAGALNNWGGSDTRDGTSRENAMKRLWIVLHSVSGEQYFQSRGEDPRGRLCARKILFCARKILFSTHRAARREENNVDVRVPSAPPRA